MQRLSKRQPVSFRGKKAYYLRPVRPDRALGMLILEGAFGIAFAESARNRDLFKRNTHYKSSG